MTEKQLTAVYYMGFDKFIMTCMHHDSFIQNSSTILKIWAHLLYITFSHIYQHLLKNCVSNHIVVFSDSWG